MLTKAAFDHLGLKFPKAISEQLSLIDEESKNE
jgi:hypothetical protein